MCFRIVYNVPSNKKNARISNEVGIDMLKVVALVENTTQSESCKPKHGLSLYIETPKHKILFDLGPNNLLLKNADALGVNLKDIDTVVISHGHVDHCGGLKSFLSVNSKAKIYLRPQALDKHYVKVLGIPFPAGINESLVKGDRFVFTDQTTVVDDEITLFSDVHGDFSLPKSDGNLFVGKDGKIVQDDFVHEQNLLLDTDGKLTLVCGCSHAGIVNIVDRAKIVAGRLPNAVIGGFHLFEPTSKRYESTEYIQSVANELLKRNATFYTCHCTGQKAYEDMRHCLGSRLNYLHTATVCNLYE